MLKLIEFAKQYLQMIKFMFVGGSGTLLNLLFLWILTDLAGFHYLISYIISFCIVLISNYTLNTYWTFKNSKRNNYGLLRYGLIGLGTLSIRQLLLYVFTDIFGIYYLLSAIIVTVISFIINFIFSKRYVWVKS